MENLLTFDLKCFNLSNQLFCHNIITITLIKALINLLNYLIETKRQGKIKTAYFIRVLCANADTK